jgi:hypothetical protein
MFDFELAPFKLTDLLSAAGATIGVIIAGVLFRQFISAKYVDLAVRYRDLTQNYRDGHGGDGRRGPLQQLIRIYRQRLRLLLRASMLAGLALLCLLGGLLSGGLSMAFTKAMVFKWTGTAGLFFGVMLIAAGVVLELWESALARHEVQEEIADLDGSVKGHAVW